jgi:SAM-dependent methyltransferase
MPEGFYRSFTEKRLTTRGAERRGLIEQWRFSLLSRYASPPGTLIEIGPGQGSLAGIARDAGWQYSAVEPSEMLAIQLRARGFEVANQFVPPIPAPDASQDVVYADQVLEHMSGIDAARAFVGEAHRVLKPRGLFFVVVPDYLKERGFFWDIDYTHNFVTTERRMRQLLRDNNFDIELLVRSIGRASGVRRDLLAGAAVLANLPGVDAMSRYTRTEELLYRVRKNLFETLTIVARKIEPGAP